MLRPTTAVLLCPIATLLLLLCLLSMGNVVSADDAEVAICNSNNLKSSQNAATATPMYTNYIRYLYATGFSTKSTEMPSTCDDIFYLYDTQPPEMDEPAVWNLYQQCIQTRINIANAAEGKDLSFQWPSAVPRFYSPAETPPQHTVKLRYYGAAYPHDFVVQRAKTTVWTAVHLVEEDQYVPHHLYQLPPDLFKAPLRFSAKGFAGLEDYLVFKRAESRSRAAMRRPSWTVSLFRPARRSCSIRFGGNGPRTPQARALRVRHGA
jgi:hypothetical protein